jgi:hypothetical protein
MIQRLSVEAAVEKIRTLYRSDPLEAEALVEGYLERETRNLSQEERLAFLDQVKEQFQPAASAGREPPVESALISQLFSLILGKKVLKEDIASKELLERLARSLNTVFDTLNELIAIIQSTFMGGMTTHETIRHFIGSHLEDAGGALSLESYINQIKEAFLITHTAFKQAAQVQLRAVFDELNPRTIEEAAAGGGGLSFGPFRRAELFEAYQIKYGKARQWLDSGRNVEELLREFEKICQRIYTEKGGTT